MILRTFLFALAAIGLPAAAQSRATEQGKAVYQSVCMACHAPENVMVSAPKLGDLKEWARRAPAGPEGLRQLTDHAITGWGAMPPKGGKPELTRAEIEAAIETMRAGLR